MKYILYGMRLGDIVSAVSVVSGVLNVEFELRESSYKGGSYYRHVSEEGWSISIETHWRDVDEVLAKPDFPQFSILIYANEVPRVIETMMDGILELQQLQSRTF
ncbi:hypothetical protein [Streptomyces sp. NPDC059466]|uniref:hypothetical protein n=1 Tax=unclassified Streptomyces TaxID=2593676 RepID=UPI0036C63E14